MIRTVEKTHENTHKDLKSRKSHLILTVSEQTWKVILTRLLVFYNVLSKSKANV